MKNVTDAAPLEVVAKNATAVALPAGVPVGATEVNGVPLPPGTQPLIADKKVPKIKKTVFSSKKTTLREWVPTHWPFGLGEKLTYVMRYGVLEGGIVTLEIDEPQKVADEAVLHYVGRVRSSRVLELFYKIDDTIESWVRIKDHLPLRHEIKQLESPKWGRRVVVFDKQTTMAKYYANATYKDGRKEEDRRDVPLLNTPQDVLGALYFYRFMAEPRGANFPIYDRFQNWSNEFVYLGTEDVTVPAGKFRALKYKMNPRITGQLEPKGDVFVWVKDDPSRILLMFKAKIKIGSLTGELKEYKEGTPMPFELPRLRTPTTLNEKGELQRH